MMMMKRLAMKTMNENNDHEFNTYTQSNHQLLNVEKNYLRYQIT